MNYKAIFFDADGVLIKNKRLFTEQLHKDYGVEIEKMQPFFTGVFRQCSVGKADLKTELAKVIESWGWKGTVEELMEYWFSKGTQVDGEILEYVKSIRNKGIKCFMTTDQEMYRGEHLRKAFGGGKVFEDVFFSAEFGCPKKMSEFWDEVFARLNQASRILSNVPITTLIDRSETFFTDDDQENVERVSEYGVNSYLFTDLDSLKQRLREYV